MLVPQGRVAILSAMETVYAKVPSTIEAVALCKMAAELQDDGSLQIELSFYNGDDAILTAQRT
jgi:phosphotransacetylase